MRSFHNLKDSALDAFKIHKSELKDDGKTRDWFSLLQIYVISQIRWFSRFRDSINRG